VRGLLRQPGFRRLYATRICGQLGDGMFQASLAGVVLFSPEREAHPADIALGFAVLLLPYSLVGPFAGVLIDRWWRQRVLVLSNLFRAVAVIGVAALISAGVAGPPLFLAALLVTSVNRFFLASLSASLPHVVSAQRELVSANAFSTTSGALAAAIGGGAAIGLRELIGDSDANYATIALVAMLPYLGAALVARGFARPQLGPDEHDRARRDSARDVYHGLIAGVRHISAVRPARDALAMIALQRFGYGISLVCTLLLYRNYFRDDGIFRADLAGLAQIAVAVAAGTGTAALITPAATRRLGPVGYPAVMLILGAVAQVSLTLQFRLPAILAGTFVLALVSQSVKICVDTVLQTQVADQYRGRVFSIYDTLFNVTFVGAAILTALALPESGRSPAAVVATAIAYVAVAGVYARSAATSRTSAGGRTTRLKT
jgi:MFS family permease